MICESNEEMKTILRGTYFKNARLESLQIVEKKD